MLEKKRKNIHDAILLNLRKVGEAFVARARENNTYRDRTGNLRSSIGYVILYNGEQIYQSFKKFPAGDQKEEPKVKKKMGAPKITAKDGVYQAKAVIDESKRKFPKGFVLIGVAGMDYAAAVESKGKDVLTGSSIQAEADLKIALDRIKKKTS